MSVSTHVPELVRRRPTDRQNSERALLSRQIPVIREMLGTLDTLTIAGQHHMMDKVIAFVDGQIRCAAAHAGERNQATIVDVMTQLRSESARLLPDLSRFAQRTENMIRLLTAI